MIVEVKGWVIVGGFMLMWFCDFVIVVEDFKFIDLVVVFGVNGVEYFVYFWEVGVCKVKEMFFIGEVIIVEEVYVLGMVNYVVLNVDLEIFIMDMVKKIVCWFMIGLKFVK